MDGQTDIQRYQQTNHVRVVHTVALAAQLHELAPLRWREIAAAVDAAASSVGVMGQVFGVPYEPINVLVGLYVITFTAHTPTVPDEQFVPYLKVQSCMRSQVLICHLQVPIELRLARN